MPGIGASVTPPACSMAHSAGWPDAFDEWRLDDSVMAEAFDSLLPTQRAAIKTSIALHFALHGEHSALTECTVQDVAKGFAYSTGQSPMAWAVLFVEPHFAAGPRLLAALMPAILAGVPLLAVACVGGEPSATVCACLELMGVEHVFCVPHVSAATNFIQQAVNTAGPRGCALFVHQGKLGPVYQAAQAAKLRCWQDQTSPRLAVDSSMAQAEALIGWCHPKAERVPAQEADALFCSHQECLQQKDIHAPSAPLVLGAGLEAFWCYQELDPRYFLQKSLIARCITDNFSKD